MSTEKKSAGGKGKRGKTETVSEKIPLGKAESVKKAIELFEKLLAEGGVKPTVAEYMRLLELQREIDRDELREIKVTWVETAEMEQSSGK
jgi:hypothetical protein